MRKYKYCARVTLVIPLIVLGAITTACYRAGEGKISVRAVPPEAYVYINGTPVGEGTARGDNSILIDGLKPGEYSVGIYNYGYKPVEEKVTVTERKTTHIRVGLERAIETIPGPFGRIIMEGPSHAAVLLNGTTPAFLVGHVDEFDKDLGWRGALLVPAGTHQVNVVHMGATVWSGSVTVPANQTVDIDLRNGGKQTTSAWPGASHFANLPPIKSSLVKTTVAVAPVTGQFSASPTEVGCGGSSQLTWSSTGAVTDQISGLGDVPASGNRQVQPTQTTSYKFTAAGPGGIVSSDAAVTVNPAIQATLNVSPAEVHYHALGDKVDLQGSATLNWSANGADSVSLDPIGSVGASGSRTVQATPSNTTPGPVDQTITYTLRATNACGGQATQTATLHITGSIETSGVNETVLETKLSLNSIYFNYNMPPIADPRAGLVPSEQARLREVAASFKQYLQYRPAAHLILGAHADQRGTSAYNMALTERRDQSVRDFLVEEGIPAADIETHAFGKEKNLTDAEVLQLNDKNPNLSPEERKRIASHLDAFRMANNRRVDITLSTTGQASLRYFPYNSDDLKVMMGPAEKPEGKPRAKKGSHAKK